MRRRHQKQKRQPAQRRTANLRIFQVWIFFDLSPEIQETATKEKETEAAEDTRSEYIFADADTRYLTKEEVDKLSLQAVCYAKNEIYARHGRKFLSTELQEYFNDKSWYQGTVEAEKFSPSVFNKYESDNIQILVKAEEKLRSGGYLLDQPGYDIHKVDTACKHSVVKKEKTDESSGHTFIVIDSDNIMHDDARIVDGKVVDAKGQEIPGCSIREDGKVVDFFGNTVDPQRRSAGSRRKLFQIKMMMLESKGLLSPTDAYGLLPPRMQRERMQCAGC